MSIKSRYFKFGSNLLILILFLVILLITEMWCYTNYDGGLLSIFTSYVLFKMFDSEININLQEIAKIAQRGLCTFHSVSANGYIIFYVKIIT